MKKTTISRIFLVALSLALIISAVFAVSAFAEEESAAAKLEIISQNVSYEGQTHLFYAVSYENVDAPEAITLEVKWTDTEGEHTATVTESESKVVEGKECRTFKTPGVDAKNFTQKFTVVAKSADGAESAPKTFSVAEYCNLWITYVAYNSVVGAPTADDLKLAEACEATLKYGSAVQALLNYYPAGNTADHPENYAYVKAMDGTVNGGNSAHVIQGESVTLAYTAEIEAGKAVSSWTVYYEDGSTEVVAANGVFAPKANCVAMAEIDVTYPEFVAGTGAYYANSPSYGIRLDYSDESQLNVIEWSSAGTPNATTAIVDGAMVFDKTAAGNDEYIFWNVATTGHGKGYDAGEAFVFEADIKFNEVSSVDEALGSIYVRNGSKISYTVGVYMNNGKINIGGAGVLEVDTWYNITLVSSFNVSAGTVAVDLYVNGSYQGVAKNSVSKTDDGNNGKAHFYLAKNETGAVTFDNVFVGYVLNLGKGAYYSNSAGYADLIRKDYEDGVAQGLWENKNLATSTVVNGANKFLNIDDGTSASSGSAEYIVFDSSSLSDEGKNTFIFETDYLISGPWSTKPEYRIRAFGYNITIGSDTWKNTAIYVPNSSSACMYVDLWYNLRFEVTKTETEGTFGVKVYLNDVLKYENAAVAGSATSSKKTIISIPSAQTGEATMYFDNVAYGYVNK